MISVPPKYAEIGNKRYAIRNNGNWYDIYRCICAFNDKELEENDRWYAAFRIFYPCKEELSKEELSKNPDDVLYGEDIENIREALNYIAWFIDCGEETNADIPKGMKKTDSGIQISFFQDMDMLVNSINATKDRDIRLSFMHWWTFVGDVQALVPTGYYKSVLEVRYKLQQHIKLDNEDRRFLQENRNRVILNYNGDWLEGED